MAIDERNFRSAYYEKVGFKSVEEKRSLEILLKEKHLDISKLKQFSLRFGVSLGHRNLMWKLLLGVLPVQENCRDFVMAQKKEEYMNLVRALSVMKMTKDEPKAHNFVAMWLLQAGKLGLKSDKENEKSLTLIFESMMAFFNDKIDLYWVTKNFHELIQRFKCEIPKLTEMAHLLLEKEDNELYKHIVEISALDILPLESWFTCCFAGILSNQVIGKIWDKICGGSYKILIYTAVVILMNFKQKLLRCDNSGKTFECFKKIKISNDESEVIVNKSIEMWQKQGSPLTVYDKPKPQVA